MRTPLCASTMVQRELIAGDTLNPAHGRTKGGADEGPPVRDLLPRLLFSPLFGLVIPNLAGFIDNSAHPPGELVLSYAYFTIVAFLIWEGNRRLHFRYRATRDWFARPWKRVAVILGALSLYTVPVALFMMWVWAAVTADPRFTMRSLALAVLIVVICTTIITHVYETVYLVRGWESDRLRNEKLRRERLEAELESLKMEVDPHVLFNQLHALSQLVESSSPKAVPFVQALADSYRYLLKTRRTRTVSVAQELALLHRFATLAEIRIPGSLELQIEVASERASQLHLPPVTLPELLDNAVKHNEASPDDPLVVTVRLDGNHLVVSNRLRPRARKLASTRVGLANLAERVRLTTRSAMVWEQADGRFTVSVPLVVAGQDDAPAESVC
jgi:sensor histidine kinase YesM